MCKAFEQSLSHNNCLQTWFKLFLMIMNFTALNNQFQLIYGNSLIVLTLAWHSEITFSTVRTSSSCCSSSSSSSPWESYVKGINQIPIIKRIILGKQQLFLFKYLTELMKCVRFGDDGISIVYYFMQKKITPKSLTKLTNSAKRVWLRPHSEPQSLVLCTLCTLHLHNLMSSKSMATLNVYAAIQSSFIVEKWFKVKQTNSAIVCWDATARKISTASQSHKNVEKSVLQLCLMRHIRYVATERKRYTFSDYFNNSTQIIPSADC